MFSFFRLAMSLYYFLYDFRIPYHVTSVGGLPISLSDHEQVEATLEIKDTS